MQQPSTALAVVDRQVERAVALVPHGFQEAMQFADQLAKSALLPPHFKGKPADVFWAIAYGLEVGLAPVAALRAVYVVHGRPGLYADAMVALVLSSGACDYFQCIESSADRAVYETKRRGAPKPVRKEFSMADAQTAQLKNNDTYQKFPAQMLAARCKSFLARDVYPDVLHGMYSVEELRDGVIDMVETPSGFVAPPPPSAGAILNETLPASSAPPAATTLPPAVEAQPDSSPDDAGSFPPERELQKTHFPIASGPPPRGPEAKAQPSQPSQPTPPPAPSSPPPAGDLEGLARQLFRQVTEAKTADALATLWPACKEAVDRLGPDHDLSRQLRDQYIATRDLLRRTAGNGGKAA